MAGGWRPKGGGGRRGDIPDDRFCYTFMGAGTFLRAAASAERDGGRSSFMLARRTPELED
eukprot:scaffold5128_cov104-Isochrysis_galbana.AAC.7